MSTVVCKQMSMTQLLHRSQSLGGGVVPHRTHLVTMYNSIEQPLRTF